MTLHAAVVRKGMTAMKDVEFVHKDGRYQFRYNGIDGKRKTVYTKL
ncbi:MAG: integrase DNA-binding domain-containing protein [Firmicutes bacterium]|nr:integrase DNA-binding domain-containing protein [Bacillota bacterium]